MGESSGAGEWARSVFGGPLLKGNLPIRNSRCRKCEIHTVINIRFVPEKPHRSIFIFYHLQTTLRRNSPDLLHLFAEQTANRAVTYGRSDSRANSEPGRSDPLQFESRGCDCGLLFSIRM
jgi:hypothetical protein